MGDVEALRLWEDTGAGTGGEWIENLFFVFQDRKDLTPDTNPLYSISCPDETKTQATKSESSRNYKLRSVPSQEKETAQADQLLISLTDKEK